jgi:hypothetical protein
MEHEKQLVNRELAQEMKELGFEQESQFYWVHHRAFTFEQKPKLVRGWNLVPLERMRPHHDSVYSAYSVAELGEMLPVGLNKGGWENWNNQLLITRLKGGWQFEYTSGDAMATGVKCRAKTEADARAKCLIYLRKNNLI